MKMNVSNSKTCTVPARYKTARAMLAPAMLLTSALLTSGCENWAGSATIDQIGRELHEVLPTVSVRDTIRSREENARFREVFFGIYPELPR